MSGQPYLRERVAGELVPFGSIDEAGLVEEHPGTPQVIMSVQVDGRPRTKGSLKNVATKGQKANLQEDDPRSVAWRQRMVTEMGSRCNFGRTPGFPSVLPVEVRCTFLFERPARTDRDFPTSQGIGADLDKLERNVLDALQEAGVIKNDAQVVRLVGEKSWATDGEPEGALITVWEAV